MFEGKLIKMLWGGINNLRVGNYKVVFMLRDPEEIRQSFEGFFSTQCPPVINKYDELMSRTIDLIENRKDTQITILQFKEVINDPIKTFTILKNNGWPINIKESVSVVDPTLYRFKKELLVKGA